MAYDSKAISDYIKADFDGKSNYLVTLKEKAHKEVYVHFHKLRKLLGPALIDNPDKVYPQISEHLLRISYALRKVAIASSLLMKLVRSSLDIAKERYRKSPNALLEQIIRELEREILVGLDAYLTRLERFRHYLPIQESIDLKDNQVFPSKKVYEFLVALGKLERHEKEVGDMIKAFFHRHKSDIKELFVAVQQLERSQLNVGEKFMAQHPPTVVGAICLTFTVVGYAGVFITLGYGIIGVAGGGSILASLFGVSKSVNGLKLLGNLFFSSGSSVLSIIVTKGVGLLGQG